jgi:hypothetical protein
MSSILSNTCGYVQKDKKIPLSFATGEESDSPFYFLVFRMLRKIPRKNLGDCRTMTFIRLTSTNKKNINPAVLRTHRASAL